MEGQDCFIGVAVGSGCATGKARLAFSPSSLDVKAIVAAGQLVWFAIDTVDSKHQWNQKTSFRGSGVLELPYTKPEKPEQGGDMRW